MDIRVNIKDNRDKKRPTKDFSGCLCAAAVLFMAASFLFLRLFRNGNHSHGVALAFAVFAGLSGVSLLICLAYHLTSGDNG